MLDENGDALPGVEARLVGAGERAPVQTDARGKFRFLYLSPGTYSVTLSLTGLATVDYQQVAVVVDRSTPLRVTMRSAGVSETVTVIGASPAIDGRKTVTGATFGEKELQEIPTPRTIWATLWAVPGVVTNQVDVAGNTAIQPQVISKGTTRTNYNLDGAGITLGGISPTFYNFDSFQQIQVITGGSDASLLTGNASFNLVTRRGTNAIHGLARYFYAPSRWQAENTPPEVDAEGITTNRTNVLRDYGIEAGGPILSDRLWIWGAWGTNLIDVQKVGQVDAAGHEFGEKSTLLNFDARLDAQLTASNSVELFYHHGNRTQHGRCPGRCANYAPESTLDLTQPVPIYKVADTQVFSPSLTASAFFAYMDAAQTSTPVGGVGTPQYLDSEGVYRGSSSFTSNDSIVRQFGASASKFFTTGNLSHELKVGFGYRYATSNSSSSLPGRQVWGDEESGLAVITRAAIAGNQQQRVGGFVSDTVTAERLTVNIGVRYDYARARNIASSVPANPDYPDILPAVHYAGDHGYPISAGSWQPRAGATYALGEKRRTLLRASYARFADLALDMVGLASPFPLTQGIYYHWTDANTKHHVDLGEIDFASGIYGSYGVDPANPGAATSPNQISPGLKPTTIDEAVVGVDQELFAGLTGSVHYTYRSIRAIAFTPPIGVTSGGSEYEYIGNASGSVADPSGFGISFDVPYYGLTIPSTGVVLRNRPGYSQTYQGVGLQLVKAFSDRWMLRGTFSWNSWKQSVSPEAIFNPNDPGGNLDGGDVGGISDWVFRLSGLYQLPHGFAVSGSFLGRQGFAQAYVVRVLTHGPAGMVAIPTSPTGTYRLPDVYELDLRIQNTFILGPVSITPSLEVFNALNANTVLGRHARVGIYNDRSDPGPPFQPDDRFNQVQDFQSPRIFRAGIRVAF
ncbi:MAG TPA: TonB-dependent receptor [Thermoanaerobaculia bacterium]